MDLLNVRTVSVPSFAYHARRLIPAAAESESFPCSTSLFARYALAPAIAAPSHCQTSELTIRIATDISETDMYASSIGSDESRLAEQTASMAEMGALWALVSPQKFGETVFLPDETEILTRGGVWHGKTGVRDPAQPSPLLHEHQLYSQNKDSATGSGSWPRVQ